MQGGSLRIERTGRDVSLLWTSNAPNERLQATGCGPWLAWTNLEVPPEWSGDTYHVSLPVTGECVLFRAYVPPLNPAVLNHVLIVGQSLAIGAGGYPVLSSNQPYANQMFVGQRLCDTRPDDLSAFVPLVERWETDTSCGETIASGFANSISARVGAGEHNLLVSNCGQGGTDYEGLKRLPAGNPSVAATGTVAYVRGLTQVVAGRGLAGPLGYMFRAVFSVHGESDVVNPTYDLSIRQWQADFQADIQARTGQAGTIPMFHSQNSSWSLGWNRAGFSPYLMLQEHQANPGTTVLVCPKYFLPYSDGLHLTAAGYRWLGEYYAKAYHQLVLCGQPWSPLRPISILRTNDTIDLTFTGAVGHLVFDTNLVSSPEGDVSDFTAGPCGPCLMVAADPDRDEFTYPGHSFIVGDTVTFYHTNPPVGVDSRRYWVTAIPGPDRFQLSTLPAGPTLDLTNASSEVLMYWPATTHIGPFGFEFFDSDGEGVPWRSATRVMKAELTGPARVRLTLNRVPTGNIRQLRYAYSVVAPNWAGPTTGPRGCLRDSDPTPSLYGNPLYNWCVHFDEPCP